MEETKIRSKGKTEMAGDDTTLRKTMHVMIMGSGRDGCSSRSSLRLAVSPRCGNLSRQLLRCHKTRRHTVYGEYNFSYGNFY